jgi:hypothetical protein
MNHTIEKRQRGTTFIKILCILTITGSVGAIILAALAAWIIYNNPDSGSASVSTDGPSSQVASFTLLVHLFGAVACISGAIKMLKRKQSGLYYFIAGVVIPDIVSVVVFGKTYVSGMMLIVFILPLLFIVAFSIYFNKMKPSV